MEQAGGGPLKGTRVIEMAGLGPVPLAGLMLAEMGATVLRIEPAGKARSFLGLDPANDLDRHGRHILKLDLKNAGANATLVELVGGADVLIEGFRPGTMEKLGLGPDVLSGRNPKLIYGRMTGFGQEGPLAARAGHDLTYLAHTGILNGIGHKDGRPVPPLNLVGDFGGGTMFLLVGILAALIELQRSGKGQVVDAAMVDGASMLAVNIFAYMAQGVWSDVRGRNLLDSGCPFYDTYEASDGGFVAVACLEPQFFAEFARLLPLDGTFIARQYDRATWDAMRTAIAERIRQRSRDEWAELFEPTDACVAPVLDFGEAAAHPHNVARGLFINKNNLHRPSPAPRLSRSMLGVAGAAVPAGHETLKAFGLPDDTVARLVSDH